MGWIALDHPWAGRFILHGGSAGLWRASVWVFLDRGFALLVASNEAGESNVEVNAAMGALLDHFRSAYPQTARRR